MKTTESRVKQNPAATHEGSYQPDVVEAKWQARWAERHINEPDLDRAARPFYNLMMFPYPSAEGLHVGNMFAFTGADTYGRFKRLQGYDVFEPIGYDAFGIHSENYAIAQGINPGKLIPQNIANFRRQLRRIGGMFDWRHELSTTDPEYYKWTQWIFLQLFKAGKAYKKAAAVNWCPKDKTVLANEQVINGRCERCDSMVEQRFLEQWFFRITDYADRLLANLDDKSKMDWSESTVLAQRNWLGRSEGAEIVFSGASVPVTPSVAQRCHPSAAKDRPSCPRSRSSPPAPTPSSAPPSWSSPRSIPLVDAFTTAEHRAEVDAYRKMVAAKDLVSRKVGEREKTGVFTGGYALNPATGEAIPVWIADYVLMEYGTGAIMAVPGHDERDFEFARRYGLPIVRVVAPSEVSSSSGADTVISSGARDRPADDGPLRSRIHRQRNRRPGPLRPVRRPPVPEAKRAITAWLAERGRGQGRGQLPAPRLDHLPPALLGPAHPHHLLRRARRRPGPGEGSSGRAPHHRGLQARRHRRLAPGPARGVVLRALSGVRQAGPARDRRERHLPRLGLVFPAVSQHRIRRPAVRSGADPEVAARHQLHRRQRARRAPSPVLALHHHGAARPGACSTSRSRSGSSGPTA